MVKEKKDKRVEPLMYVKGTYMKEDNKNKCENAAYAVISESKDRYILISLYSGNKYRMKKTRTEKSEEGNVIVVPNFKEVAKEELPVLIEKAHKNFKLKVNTDA